MQEKTLALCIDARGGMMFNRRRQVKDAEIIADMIERFGKNGVFASPYSARLLEGYEGVTLCERPIEESSPSSLIFVEDPELITVFEEIDTVVIYRYGIPYPADRYFEYDLIALGYKRISKDKLSTKIHQKAEREVYKKVLIN